MSASFASPQLRNFYLQPFLPGVWYDMLPIQPLLAAIALHLRKPFVAFVREGARKQAAYDCSTVYKSSMQTTSMEQLILHHRVICSRYYNCIESACEVVSWKHTRFWLAGWPRYLLPWFVPMQEAYTTEAMSEWGAANVTVTSTDIRPHGPPGRLELVRVSFEARWG